MKASLLGFFLLLPFSVSAAPYLGADGVSTEITSPKKIIVLNASNVEILYALGAENLIVGTDVSAQFPAAAKDLPKVGHPYRPSVEGMISLKPDLVISSVENLPQASATQLRSAKVPVLIVEDSGKLGVDGLKKRIHTISEVIGKKEAGEQLVKKMDVSFKAIPQAKSAVPLKVFFLYAHGPGEAYIYGRQTGSHELIELVGAKNAADFTTGTKPLTAEAMVQASPDAIIMLNRGLKAVGGVEGALKLPGVTLTPAGKNKKIIAVDDSIRWVSPRFPEFADALQKELLK